MGVYVDQGSGWCIASSDRRLCVLARPRFNPGLSLRINLYHKPYFTKFMVTRREASLLTKIGLPFCCPQQRVTEFPG